MIDINRDILIVDGRSDGMIAGLLFARAGLKGVVLEKHADLFAILEAIRFILRRWSFYINWKC